MSTQTSMTEKNMQKPSRKIAAVSIAGSITTVLVFVLASLGVSIPPEVAAAVTTLIASVLGYVVPNA